MPKGNSGIIRDSVTGAVYTKKQIAELKAKDEEYISELAKKGEMPHEPERGMRDAMSRVRLMEAYEMIDRHYAMPSQEYLEQSGIKLTSWHKKHISGIGYVRSMKVEREGYTESYISVPYRASKSAMNGAIKIHIYHELRNMRKLQKKQFKLSKK